MKWELQDNQELELRMTKRGLWKRDLEMVLYDLAPDHPIEEEDKEIFEGKYLGRTTWLYRKTSPFSPYVLEQSTRTMITSGKNAGTIARESLIQSGCRYGGMRSGNAFIDAFRIKGIFHGEDYYLDYEGNPRFNTSGRRVRFRLRPKCYETSLYNFEGKFNPVKLIDSLDEIRELELRIDTLVWDTFEGYRKRAKVYPILQLSYSEDAYVHAIDYRFITAGDNRKTGKRITLKDTITSDSLQDADIPEKIKELERA